MTAEAEAAQAIANLSDAAVEQVIRQGRDRLRAAYADMLHHPAMASMASLVADDQPKPTATDLASTAQLREQLEAAERQVRVYEERLAEECRLREAAEVSLMTQLQVTVTARQAVSDVVVQRNAAEAKVARVETFIAECGQWDAMLTSYVTEKLTEALK